MTALLIQIVREPCSGILKYQKHLETSWQGSQDRSSVPNLENPRHVKITSWHDDFVALAEGCCEY